MLQAHMCNILSIHAFICTLHWSALHGKEEPLHKSQLVEWRRDDILVTFASQKMTLTVTTLDHQVHCTMLNSVLELHIGTCCSNQRHPAKAPSRKQRSVPHLHTMHHPHTSLDDCSLPSWIPECSGPARTKLWHIEWRTAGRFVRRATARSFFWHQKVRFWGKTFVTEVQKSFICPIKDHFGLQPKFINKPFVALRYMQKLWIFEIEAKAPP